MICRCLVFCQKWKKRNYGDKSLKKVNSTNAKWVSSVWKNTMHLPTGDQPNVTPSHISNNAWFTSLNKHVFAIMKMYRCHWDKIGCLYSNMMDCLSEYGCHWDKKVVCIQTWWIVWVNMGVTGTKKVVCIQTWWIVWVSIALVTKINHPSLLLINVICTKRTIYLAVSHL